jgi:hypothetical protein
MDWWWLGFVPARWRRRWTSCVFYPLSYVLLGPTACVPGGVWRRACSSRAFPVTLEAPRRHSSSSSREDSTAAVNTRVPRCTDGHELLLDLGVGDVNVDLENVREPSTSGVARL